jgi:UDP-glucose:tetrahydrobiopterin glucosyltransferase
MRLEFQQTSHPLQIAVLAHLHHPIVAPFAGGMESHTAHLVCGLSARGHEVTLFAKEGSRTECRVEPVLDATFIVRGYPDEDHRNRQHRILDAAMSRALTRIRTGSYDLVLNNSLSPVPYRELGGIPTLHVLHTPALPRLIEIFDTPGWEADATDRFITVSEANARAWRRWLPGIQVVHNGISLDEWAEDSVQECGTAAWSGRITPEKGTHVAIAAARAASMKLRLAGPIQDRDYFRTLIEPQLDDDITYMGHLDQGALRSMVAGAQVFISSPMWEEPFGLTTLEAMACGTPVAALPAGAMHELVGTLGGVVAKRGGVEALAVAIRDARDMDRVAVRVWAQSFSLSAMIDSYEKLFGSLVADPRPKLHGEA